MMNATITDTTWQKNERIGGVAPMKKDSNNHISLIGFSKLSKIAKSCTEIKHVENSLEILNEFGIEIDLESILVEEFEQGLPSDISNSF